MITTLAVYPRRGFEDSDRLWLGVWNSISFVNAYDRREIGLDERFELPGVKGYGRRSLLVAFVVGPKTDATVVYLLLRAPEDSSVFRIWNVWHRIIKRFFPGSFQCAHSNARRSDVLRARPTKAFERFRRPLSRARPDAYSARAK